MKKKIEIVKDVIAIIIVLPFVLLLSPIFIVKWAAERVELME